MDHDYGGFTSAEEKAHFESYAKLIEFAQSVSQFSINCGTLICPVLRQRMHVSFFSLLKRYKRKNCILGCIQPYLLSISLAKRKIVFIL